MKKLLFAIPVLAIAFTSCSQKVTSGTSASTNTNAVNTMDISAENTATSTATMQTSASATTTTIQTSNAQPAKQATLNNQ